MHGWVSRSSAVCRGCAGEGRGREGRGGDPCPRWVWRREHGANTWTKHTDPHVQAVMSRQTKGTLVEHHARHGQCRGLDVFGSNTHLFSLESRWMEDSRPASQLQGHEKGFSWENSYHNISQLGLLPFKSLCVGGSAQRNPAGRGPFGGLRPATFAVTACSGGTLPGGSEEEFHGSLKGGEKAPSWLLGPLCSQPLHREAGRHGEPWGAEAEGCHPALPPRPGTPTERPADTCHASPDEGTPRPVHAMGNALLCSEATRGATSPPRAWPQRGLGTLTRVLPWSCPWRSRTVRNEECRRLVPPAACPKTHLWQPTPHGLQPQPLAPTASCPVQRQAGLFLGPGSRQNARAEFSSVISGAAVSLGFVKCRISHAAAAKAPLAPAQKKFPSPIFL